MKNSKLSHQRELIEERERAANAMKDEREKHVLHLAREKEEHRKMLESIQMITYKNLDLERQKIKSEWDQLEATKKNGFGGFISAAIDSVVTASDDGIDSKNALGNTVSPNRRSSNPFEAVEQSLKQSQRNYHSAISSLSN